MPPAKKKRLGVGAVISCFARYVEPKQEIKSRFVNTYNEKRLINCRVVGQRIERIRSKQVDVVVFHCDELMKDDTTFVDLFTSKNNVKIETVGPRHGWFDITEPTTTTTTTEAEAAPEELPEVVRNAINNNTIIDDEIIMQLGDLVQIDDDNAPAPENIPDNNEVTFTATLGFSGTCYRRERNALNMNPAVNPPTPEWKPDYVELFLLLFPKQYLIKVILTAINSNPEIGQHVTIGEFLRWLGLWLLMSTIQGPQREDFWKMTPPDMFSGAPFRFNNLMSAKRFNDILRLIRYTNNQPPTYQDKFWRVREMINKWNENMQKVFVPGWINCLDESMSTWTNKFTCPGFMFVPRKPWPFGNEWYSIACGISGIMFGLELVEGKDEPPERSNLREHDNLGKTVGLLLRLCKSLYYTNKLVVLDSGFCVLKALVELRIRGVFGAAVIKKEGTGRSMLMVMQ
jgi:Transposase IS4